MAIKSRESGHYFIDPDGPGVGASPVQVIWVDQLFKNISSMSVVQVYCDLRSGTTRVGHDLQGEQEVNNCR